MRILFFSRRGEDPIYICEPRVEARREQRGILGEGGLVACERVVSIGNVDHRGGRNLVDCCPAANYTFARFETKYRRLRWIQCYEMISASALGDYSLVRGVFELVAENIASSTETAAIGLSASSADKISTWWTSPIVRGVLRYCL